MGFISSIYLQKHPSYTTLSSPISHPYASIVLTHIYIIIRITHEHKVPVAAHLLHRHQRRLHLLLRGRRRQHRHSQRNSNPASTQKIYHRTITPEPAASIPAGRHILENLTVCEQKQIVVANANAHVVVFTSVEGGKQLEELYRFEADFAAKDATIVPPPTCRTLFAFPRKETWSVWVAMIPLSASSG